MAKSGKTDFKLNSLDARDSERPKPCDGHALLSDLRNVSQIDHADTTKDECSERHATWEGDLQKINIVRSTF